MVKTVKLVTPSDLSTDFVVKGDKVQLNKSIRQVKIEYAVGKNIATTNNPVDYERQERRQLTLHSSGLGKIHLDFKAVTNINQTVFTLPSSAPTPLELIEFMFADGGTIWVGAGSRNIVGNGLKANTRYLVDLVGFFS